MKALGYRVTRKVVGIKTRQQYSAILLENGLILTARGNVQGSTVGTSNTFNGPTKDGNTVGVNPVKLGGKPSPNLNAEELRKRADAVMSKFNETSAEKSNNGELIHASLKIIEIADNAKDINFNNLPSSAVYMMQKFNNLYSSALADDKFATVIANFDTSPSIAEAFIELVYDNNKRNFTTKPAEKPLPAVEKPKKFYVTGQVFQSDGKEYKPRQINGHHDVALLQHLNKSDLFVRVFGPPGGGKSSLVKAAFPNCITVNGHGDLTVANFVGTLLPTTNGGWEWFYGPLSRAMMEGKPFFLDEINRTPTEILAILYSVMDDSGVLRLDDRPDVEPLKAKPGFSIIAGYNPETLGAREIDEALLSRFKIGIEVLTDYATARALGVPEKAIALSSNLNTTNLKSRKDYGSGNWVPQMRELLTFRDIINSGLDEDFALSALLGACPRETDLEDVQKAAKEVFGFHPSILSLGPAA